ncbi:NACHT domain-containing protein [Herbiconiux daphne]|uniref:ATP-binding protein n=1 Tax=Herbiconiux daphne TaxID=2970914 RepID=A0ABT2H558_9MICO|nr:ATP-binding protein [Herbiconiux daphne]MCS5735061.1 ATP-binding protein [Herbiconiux daphne]
MSDADPLKEVELQIQRVFAGVINQGARPRMHDAVDAALKECVAVVTEFERLTGGTLSTIETFKLSHLIAFSLDAADAKSAPHSTDIQRSKDRAVRECIRGYLYLKRNDPMGDGRPDDEPRESPVTRGVGSSDLNLITQIVEDLPTQDKQALLHSARARRSWAMTRYARALGSSSRETRGPGGFSSLRNRCALELSSAISALLRPESSQIRLQFLELYAPELAGSERSSDHFPSGNGIAQRLLKLSKQFANDIDPRINWVDDGSASHTTESRAIVGRTAEETLRRYLARDSKPGWLLVSGPSGAGKSSLLWSTYSRETEHGSACFFIPASSLLASDGSSPIVQFDDLIRGIEDAANRRKIVVLIDAADAVVHIDEVRSDLSVLIERVIECQGHIILSCRPDAVGAFTIDGRERVELGPFDDQEVEQLAIAGGVGGRLASLIFNELSPRTFWRLPLNYSLIRDLMDGPGAKDLSFKKGEVEVFRILWQLRVESDRRAHWPRTSSSANLAELANSVAIVMLSHDRTDMNFDALVRHVATKAGGEDRAKAGLQDLVSRGILQLGSSRRVGFFHQSFLEYVAAGAILARGRDEIAGVAKLVCAASARSLQNSVFEAMFLILYEEDRRNPILADVVDRLLEAEGQAAQSSLVALWVARPELLQDDPLNVLRLGDRRQRQDAGARLGMAQIGPAVVSALLREILSRDDTYFSDRQHISTELCELLSTWAASESSEVLKLMARPEVDVYIRPGGDKFVGGSAWQGLLSRLADASPTWFRGVVHEWVDAGADGEKIDRHMTDDPWEHRAELIRRNYSILGIGVLRHWMRVITDGPGDLPFSAAQVVPRVWLSLATPGTASIEVSTRKAPGRKVDQLQRAIVLLALSDPLWRDYAREFVDANFHLFFPAPTDERDSIFRVLWELGEQSGGNFHRRVVQGMIATAYANQAFVTWRDEYTIRSAAVSFFLDAVPDQARDIPEPWLETGLLSYLPEAVAVGVPGALSALELIANGELYLPSVDGLLDLLQATSGRTQDQIVHAIARSVEIGTGRSILRKLQAGSTEVNDSRPTKLMAELQARAARIKINLMDDFVKSNIVVRAAAAENLVLLVGTGLISVASSEVTALAEAETDPKVLCWIIDLVPVALRNEPASSGEFKRLLKTFAEHRAAGPARFVLSVECDLFSPAGRRFVESWRVAQLSSIMTERPQVERWSEVLDLLAPAPSEAVPTMRPTTLFMVHELSIFWDWLGRCVPESSADRVQDSFFASISSLKLGFANVLVPGYERYIDLLARLLDGEELVERFVGQVLSLDATGRKELVASMCDDARSVVVCREALGALALHPGTDKQTRLEVTRALSHRRPAPVTGRSSIEWMSRRTVQHSKGCSVCGMV